MKLLRTATLLGLLALNTSACALGALQGGTINTPPPTPAPVYKAIAIVIHDEFSRPIAGIACGLEGLTDQGNVSNDDGYIAWGNVPATVHEVTVVCGGGDYLPFTEKRTLALETNEDMLPATMLSQHVDPRTISLEALAAIRGAMWTTRINVPFGPRPGQDSNILATDFLGLYDSPTQARMLDKYQSQGYTHAVTGPVAGSDCYHGLYPCNTAIPTQAAWDAYLDLLQTQFWDRHIVPVFFAKPDGWERAEHAADMDALDALFTQPRAQKLIRVVVYPGWEPSGEKYGWTNATYVAWVARGARVFPNALRALHLVSDLDAPTGGNDDQTFPKGEGNARSWTNVVPFIHIVLVQVGGYVGNDTEIPNPAFVSEFKKLWPDLSNKFNNGQAGWPTSSAWGPGRAVRVCYAEGSAYGDFWHNWDERYALDLGDLAMQTGADCYLDGGRVAVPIK